MTSNDSGPVLVQTEDGSHTVLHPELNEPYHSRQGAVSEAFHKFVLPTKLEERLKHKNLRLLDVGLGLGVNCRAALSCEDPYGIHIDTLEQEPAALERGLLAFPDDPLLLQLQQEGQTSKVQLHLGDLRKTLRTLSSGVDVIFHDPFSPMKNSEAWTVEVFCLMKELIQPDGILATYSESRIVRTGLLEAGWYVGTSEAVPPHRGGTVATVKMTHIIRIHLEAHVDLL